QGLGLVLFDSGAENPYHYAVMSSGPPEFLDLAHVTRQPLELAGRIRVGSMPRLRAVLADDDGEVAFRLRARHEAGRTVVQGQADAELMLACQRCLQPMRQALSTEFRLAWVRNEAEAAALEAGSCEPLLAPDGRVRVSTLLEDELLLALPIVALHETQSCRADVVAGGVEQAAMPQAETEPNPFAMLQQLKTHR
ncbi:MAG TPA: YceD family protein, partial [Gammaproteobacteria bacterium]|nr:YceD family protein [Gammaproteobacteria bacterium]